MQNSFTVILYSTTERCPLKNYLLEDFSEEKNHDIAKNSLLDAKSTIWLIAGPQCSFIGKITAEATP